MFRNFNQTFTQLISTGQNCPIKDNCLFKFSSCTSDIMQLQQGSYYLSVMSGGEVSEMGRVRASCSSAGFRCHLPVGRAQSASTNQRRANSGSTNQRRANSGSTIQRQENSSSLFCPAGHRQPVKGRTLLM